MFAWVKGARESGLCTAERDARQLVSGQKPGWAVLQEN